MDTEAEHQYTGRVGITHKSLERSCEGYKKDRDVGSFVALLFTLLLAAIAPDNVFVPNFAFFKLTICKVS